MEGPFVTRSRAVDSLSRSERTVREASRARRDAERGALRSAILAAAGEVFLESGFEAFSMRQVAARIGYSATTIYHHFLNKEELLKAVLEQAFARFEEATLKVLEDEMDPSRRMGALGKAYVRFGVAHPVLYQLMYLRRPAANEGEPLACSSASPTYRALQEGVRRGIETGLLPSIDSQALSDWMWATVHGLVMLGITEFRDDPARLEAAMALFDLPRRQHDSDAGGPASPNDQPRTSDPIPSTP